MGSGSLGHDRTGVSTVEVLPGAPWAKGFAVAVRRYAELARKGEPTVAERLRLLTEHDAQVGERIAVLQAQRQHLREKISWDRSQLSAEGRP